MTLETVYRAAFVLPVTSAPIRDGFVAVRDGVVTGLGAMSDRPRGRDVTEIDLGKTILMPGFVNAHTHLELSHLEGAVPADRGFVAWIEDQLRVRAERSVGEIPVAIRKAMAALEAGGTVALADVSNSLAAVGPLEESPLHALVLHEILGFDPAKAIRGVRAVEDDPRRRERETGPARPHRSGGPRPALDLPRAASNSS